MTRLIIRTAVIVLALALALPTQAQTDEDRVTEGSIGYDQSVEDTITERSFYDLWEFTAAQGDVAVITMIAADGLAPLLGLLDSNRDLIANSGVSPDGEPVTAQPDGIAELEFLIPADGQYSIVATRVGNDQGTTTGSYILRLRRANTAGERFNPYQAVQFRCRDALVTTAATLQFGGTGMDTLRISVYGLDDFQPVVQVGGNFEGAPTVCAGGLPAMAGDMLVLPDGETFTVPEADGDSIPQAAQIVFQQARLVSDFVVTIGSVNGAAGRYVAVIEGFMLSADIPRKYIDARIGPLAVESDLLVYMLAGGGSRIDPFITLVVEEALDAETGDLQVEPQSCDDAGRRGCDEVSSAQRIVIAFNDGTRISGGRLDAGLLLSPESTAHMLLEFRSRSNANGPFTVLMLGELPARGD